MARPGRRCKRSLHSFVMSRLTQWGGVLMASSVGVGCRCETDVKTEAKVELERELALLDPVSTLPPTTTTFCAKATKNVGVLRARSGDATGSGNIEVGTVIYRDPNWAALALRTTQDTQALLVVGASGGTI